MQVLTSKQARWFLLIALIAVGFFLRSYHFSDWLHFELDQARDARIVDDGLRGDFWDLPLLGPKAGGTTLRLPPAFYYFEYVSALLFGGSPAGIATLSMILSVATIGVFFLLLRRYFSWGLALGLTLLMAVSEFFVMYGRFAWNPNLIPFFLVLGLYALLRAVDREEPQRGRYFLLAAGALTLVTQFHFLAFLAVPTIGGLFLIVRRPHFSLRVWGGALLIVALLYAPMFLNESATGFANAKAFVQAVTKKSGKSDHSLVEKAIKNVAEHALYGLVVTTGIEKGAFPSIVVGTNEGEWVGWACDARCDQGKWYGVAAVIILLLSIGALIVLWWKESVHRRADFLLLSSLWLGVTFVLFLPLAYDIAPRFFLVSGPVFIILLGLLLLLVARVFHVGAIAQWIPIGILLLFVISNGVSLATRFQEIALSPTQAINSPPDRILKERIRVPLFQQEAIVSFLKGRARETGYPVYMWSEPQHRRALKYLLEKRGVTNDVLETEGLYQEGVYYLILRAQSDLDEALLKYRTNYTVGTTTSFGTLVAIELLPKPEAIKRIRQDFSKAKPNDSQGLPRYTWREFFSQRGARSNEDDQPEEIDETL